MEVCPGKCARRGMPYCAHFGPPHFPLVAPFAAVSSFEPMQISLCMQQPSLATFHHHQRPITQPVPGAQGAAAVAEGRRRGGEGGRRQPSAATGLARRAARAHLLHPHLTIGRTGRAYAFRLVLSVNCRRSAGLAHGSARAHPQHPCTPLGPPYGAERAALQHMKDC